MIYEATALAMPCCPSLPPPPKKNKQTKNPAQMCGGVRARRRAISPVDGVRRRGSAGEARPSRGSAGRLASGRLEGLLSSLTTVPILDPKSERQK